MPVTDEKARFFRPDGVVGTEEEGSFSMGIASFEDIEDGGGELGATEFETEAVAACWFTLDTRSGPTTGLDFGESNCNTLSLSKVTGLGN